MQRSFHLDLNQCTGCEACVVACAIENELPWGTSWRRVETHNENHLPGIPFFHLSLACNHCADAPCQKHCPALAYSKDEFTGAVVLDPNLCMGCKYCTWACPYDAPAYNPSVGVVEKCTFCNDRQKEGHSPACVAQCPTGALQLGELDGSGEWRALDTQARASLGHGGASRDGGHESPEEVPSPPQAAVEGFPSTSARPSIRFTPLRANHLFPKVASEASWWGPGPAPMRASARISLRREWPLAVFTLLTAFLVGWMAARVAGPRLGGLGMRGPGFDARLAPLFFLGLSLAGMGLSTLHLGRKSRAYRSILNLRHSWLSREIFFYSAFVGLAGISWLHSPLNAAAQWAAPITGFAALFSMDSVYLVTGTQGLRRHSAQVFLTGLLVFSLMSSSVVLVGGFLLLKLLLYLARKIEGPSPWRVRLGWIGLLRLGGGILLPVAVWWWKAEDVAGLVLLLIALGEILDRCEFYRELRVTTPRRQIETDLRKALANVLPAPVVP